MTYSKKNLPATIGFDEVGRGCIAGPLVVAGVRLNCEISGLADSKQLSQRRRSILERAIRQQADDIAIAWIDAATIDAIGLGSALERAFMFCFSSIYKEPHDTLIIDGAVNYLRGADNYHTHAVVKADSSINAVMAASIIAKQARDRYMRSCADCFPGFGFEKHVGYGTALHYDMIKNFGLTPLHRKSIQSLGQYVSKDGQNSRNQSIQLPEAA